MTMRVGVLFAAVALVRAQSQHAVEADDIAGFLQSVREPAAQRDALFRSGVSSLSSGRYSEAEATFRRLMVQEQTGTRGLEGVARVYLAQNRNDEALALLQNEVAQHPARPDILLAFVHVAEKLRQYDAALGALRSGKELRPEDVNVSLEVARLLELSGREPEAIPTYREALGIDPLDGAALLRRASQLSESGGDLDVAVACAERARKLLPENLEVSASLAWIYLKKNMSSLAIPLFEDLVTKAPSIATHHYRLAMALYQSGNTARGMSELRTALECHPTESERKSIEDLIAIGEVRQ